jgi:hypothetical protein
MGCRNILRRTTTRRRRRRRRRRGGVNYYYHHHHHHHHQHHHHHHHHHVSSMQGIYTYISEPNNVPKEYNVAALLSLMFMVPISLVSALTLMYFYISTFRSMCAVLNMTVFCGFLTS